MPRAEGVLPWRTRSETKQRDVFRRERVRARGGQASWPGKCNVFGAEQPRTERTERMTDNTPRFASWPEDPARPTSLVESYRFGQRHGWAAAFYADGRKACEGVFRDGNEEGWWVFWNEDGSTAAVVEFRRGRPVSLDGRGQNQQQRLAA
jgi:hypothetical protein